MSPSALSAKERVPFILGIVNGAFYFLASALIDPNIVIAQFVGHLGPAKELAGLAPAILSGGWFLPQLFMAVYAGGLPYKKPIYSLSAYIRVLAMGGVALAVALSGRLSPSMTLWAFYLFLALFATGTGIGGVAFMDMVGKTIPKNRLSEFFSWRLLAGGILGFGGGFLVRAILADETRFPFPKNYGLIFGLAWICYSIAVMTYVFVPEPPSPRRDPKSLGERWKEALSPFWKDPQFRRLIFARWAVYFAAIAVPYYALFAKESLGAPESMAGVYISTQVLAGALSNLAWGKLGDRLGGRSVLVGGALLAASASGCALLLSLAQFQRPYLMAGVFALVGMAINALTVSGLAFILELAPPAQREEYVGLHYSLTAPTILAPVLGGQLLRVSSFPVLFGVSTLLGLLGSVVAWRLPKSRD